MPADPHEFEELVLEHIDAENARSVDRLLMTYSETPELVDVPTGRHFTGAESILSFYQERWTAFPGSRRAVLQLQTSEDASYLELEVTGRHDGPYRGLAATHRPVSIPICQRFDPGPDGKIRRVTLYYDLLTVMTQLGVLPDLASTSGRAWLALHRPSLALRTVATKLAKRGE